MSDLKALIQQCDSCLSRRDYPGKEPLKSHEFAKRPRSKVGADICYLDNRSLLVIVDYYSNFIEVCRLQSQVTNSVIREMQGAFARFGVPDQLAMDNGPQFRNEAFARFASSWGFEHVTSSPNYPQSNGKAENAVKTVKKLFTKCKLSHGNEFMALLNWRNTPSEGMSLSPAQRLMGRRCKTVMPCKESLLKPNYSTWRDSRDLYKKKRKQAKYYNKNSRKRALIYPGQTVRMRLPGSKLWTPGICIEKAAPRTYYVKVGNTTYRSNRQHLIVTKERSKSNDEWDRDSVQDSTTALQESTEQEQTKDPEVLEEISAETQNALSAESSKVLRQSTRNRRPPEWNGMEYEI